ncbi:MAG TPA: hypothetical protein VG935_04630 [Patescibacteria group bacterium]|nr:hypothetical protein [Patescibacteria group bacterium]
MVDSPAIEISEGQPEEVASPPPSTKPTLTSETTPFPPQAETTPFPDEMPLDKPEKVAALHTLFADKLAELHADQTKSLKDKTNEALLYGFCLAMTTKLRYLYSNYPSGSDDATKHARAQALSTLFHISKRHFGGTNLF